jgi:hypothetical protein
MFIDLLRVVGVLVVGVVLLMPSGKHLDALYDRNNQVLVGLVVVANTLFVDPIFGGLLGLAVLIWVFKMNQRRLVSSSLSMGGKEGVYAYGTAKNLMDAQTNVVNERMLNTEMVGFDGVHGEQVIGAQGLDRTMPGYNKNDASQPAPVPKGRGAA